MIELAYKATMNFNRVELDSWFDKKRLADGRHKLVGMCCRTEYDANTGEVVLDEVTPTGVNVLVSRR